METEGKEKALCTGIVENKHPVKSPGYIKSLLLRVTRIWPLKYMFQVLQKIAALAGLSGGVENIGSAEQSSPSALGRRYLCGRKRIGRLARLILSIAPYKLQCALGYHSAESLGQATGSDDVRKSPLKPCGKGSKRKQDDVDLEEQHSWVAFLSEDLPDEDQEDDPTYEPSKSETDSEEIRSRNETESDIEVEEKDGNLMIKEYPVNTEGESLSLQGDSDTQKESPANEEPEHDDNQPIGDEQKPASEQLPINTAE
ncbi:hypothetical protein FKM82_014862 [Ascaphus truei]